MIGDVLPWDVGVPRVPGPPARPPMAETSYDAILNKFPCELSCVVRIILLEALLHRVQKRIQIIALRNTHREKVVLPRRASKSC